MKQTKIDIKLGGQADGNAAYTAPRLVVHGKVSDLTMAQSGSNFESVILNNGVKSKPG